MSDQPDPRGQTHKGTLSGLADGHRWRRTVERVVKPLNRRYTR